MLRKRKKMIVLWFMSVFYFSLIFPPFNSFEVDGANPPAFFTLSVLAPNDNPVRNEWATLMVEQLPKIGIGVDVFDHTGWAQISPRTWGHPGPYPIPTYAEGGFDIFFFDLNWGLDIDLNGLFDTQSFPPFGRNIFQYSRPEMDWAIGNYSQSFVLADRIQYAHDIQALLYEDVPQATITYTPDVYPHTTALDPLSWTPLLWDTSYQDMVNWSIPGQTEFHYGCPTVFNNFHVMKIDSISDAQWTHQIYGGMVERIPEAPYNNAYGPYACTSFSSANGLNYSVQLDPNLVFADGHKCNASDVEYSYDLLIDPDFNQPDYGFYSQYIDSNTIKIVNEYEIQVDFLQAYVFQDSNLGIDILPKHIWKDFHPLDHESLAAAWALDENLTSNLMGIGPYYMHNYDNLMGIIHLKANPYWTNWGGHAPQNFTDIYFEFWSHKEGALSALAAGTLDMVDSQFMPQLAEIPATVDYTFVVAPNSQEMGFNCLHPYLSGTLAPISAEDSGKYIRQAISHLIPRETIVEEILNGLGSPGITAYPKVIGFDDTLLKYEYSIDIAKQKMELAGYEYPGPFTGYDIKIWPCVLMFTAIGIGILAGLALIIGLPIWAVKKSAKDSEIQEIVMKKEKIEKSSEKDLQDIIKKREKMEE